MQNAANCDIRTEGNSVTVRGELDHGNADDLREAVLEARRHPPRAPVVDLTAVTFLDSSIISVLFDHAEQLHLKLATHTVVERILELTGLLSAPGVWVTYPNAA